jgi:hypothetical protein
MGLFPCLTLIPNYCGGVVGNRSLLDGLGSLCLQTPLRCREGYIQLLALCSVFFSCLGSPWSACGVQSLKRPPPRPVAASQFKSTNPSSFRKLPALLTAPQRTTIHRFNRTFGVPSRPRLFCQHRGTQRHTRLLDSRPFPSLSALPLQRHPVFRLIRGLSTSPEVAKKLECVSDRPRKEAGNSRCWVSPF